MKKGDQEIESIIRDFDLMKNDKKFDLMNLTSWKNEFWSHEIRPPDPEPKNYIQLLKPFLKVSCS